MAMTPGAWIQSKTNNRPIEWDTYLALMRALGHAAAANGWDKPKKKAARAELTRLLRAAGYNLANFPYEQVVAGGDYVLTNRDKPPKQGETAKPAQTAKSAASRGGMPIQLGRFGTWLLRPVKGSQTVLYNESGHTVDVFGRIFDKLGKQIGKINFDEVGEIWEKVLGVYERISGWNETLQDWYEKFPRIHLPEVPGFIKNPLGVLTGYNKLKKYPEHLANTRRDTLGPNDDITDEYLENPDNEPEAFYRKEAPAFNRYWYDTMRDNLGKNFGR